MGTGPRLTVLSAEGVVGMVPKHADRGEGSDLTHEGGVAPVHLQVTRLPGQRAQGRG